MKDLSLHILDIIENSVNAGAKNIEINIKENTSKDLLTIRISDDGKGMEKELLNTVSNPFVTTKKNKKIGLGLSLLKQAAEAANGHFLINSENGIGTKIKATFQNSHIDRKPIGDLAETLISAILLAPETEFVFTYKKDSADLILKTKDLKQQIGIDSLTDTNILKELKVIVINKLKEL